MPATNIIGELSLYLCKTLVQHRKMRNVGVFKDPPSAPQQIQAIASNTYKLVNRFLVLSTCNMTECYEILPHLIQERFRNKPFYVLCKMWMQCVCVSLTVTFLGMSLKRYLSDICYFIYQSNLSVSIVCLRFPKLQWPFYKKVLKTHQCYIKHISANTVWSTLKLTFKNTTNTPDTPIASLHLAAKLQQRFLPSLATLSKYLFEAALKALSPISW